MTPLIRYQQAIASGTLQPDTHQEAVVHALEIIFHAVEDQPTWWNFWRRWLAPKGLYVWGSVGVGKTVLIDLFYDCLTVTKRRQHFFAFMQDVHHALKTHQGEKNPLQSIANNIAKTTRVICFDEFFVTDIADAMILGELFIALFKAGITLITTSNIAPDHLYKEGLQRRRFIPAIEALKAHCKVMHLEQSIDYRRTKTDPAATYFTPITAQNDAILETLFLQYTDARPVNEAALSLQGHTLTIRKQAAGVLWCDFQALCEQPLSQKEYLQIAQQFHTLILSNIPIIPAKSRNTVLRFIHLIDILYDNHLRLIVSADTTPDQLYPKGPHTIEFKRTTSRLIEMQSTNYFNQQ